MTVFPGAFYLETLEKTLGSPLLGSRRVFIYFAHFNILSQFARYSVEYDGSWCYTEMVKSLILPLGRQNTKVVFYGRKEANAFGRATTSSTAYANFI